MPRIRDAIRSGWKYSSWSSFSPTETSLIGLPVTALTESAAPPRASPSSFVRTTPSNAIRSKNDCATLTASWPVIASRTRRTFVGLAASRTRASSSISSSSTCRRPAVSRMTTSWPAVCAPPGCPYFDDLDRDPRVACGRRGSGSAGRAARAGRSRPGAGGRRRRARASCPPCAGAARASPRRSSCRSPGGPASRITVGGRPNASRESPEPISAVSSSWTIFTTCWPASGSSARPGRSRARAPARRSP